MAGGPALALFSQSSGFDSLHRLLEDKAMDYKLYQLPAAYKEAEARIIDGELTDEDIKRIDGLDLNLEDRVEAWLFVAKNFEARAEAARPESERLAKLVKTAEKGAQRALDHVEDVLKEIGQDRVETKHFVARLQKGPPKVAIADGFDLTALPEEWLLPAKNREPDKKAILAASKDAPLPEGVSIVQEKSLRVS